MASCTGVLRPEEEEEEDDDDDDEEDDDMDPYSSSSSREELREPSSTKRLRAEPCLRDFGVLARPRFFLRVFPLGVDVNAGLTEAFAGSGACPVAGGTGGAFAAAGRGNQ